MENYTEKIEKRVKELVEKNIDAHKGFEKGSENAEPIGLKTYFKGRATERAEFISELRKEAATYGLNVSTDGSVAGDAHRTWMDMKALFSSDKAESMLEEAIRGEKAALKEYDEVLSEDLPASTRSIVAKQRSSIAQTLNQVKTLEDLKELN